MTTITEMLAQDMTRDEIIIALVTQQGMTINKATNTYGAYAKEHGLTKDIVSHKKAALDMLIEQYAEDLDGWTVKAVKDAVIDITTSFDVAESTARDYCKAFSKQMGVTHPTENPAAAMLAWLVDNHECTKEEFVEYAKEELGRSDSNINEYWKGMTLHRLIMRRHYS